jgi:hypothetical protein
MMWGFVPVLLALGILVVVPFHLHYEHVFLDELRKRKPEVVARYTTKGISSRFPDHFFVAHFLRRKFCSDDTTLSHLRRKLMLFYCFYTALFLGIVVSATLAVGF